MASWSAPLNQATQRIAFTLQPIRTRWDNLETGARRLLLIGALLLAAGLTWAFVWLPAVRTRDAMTARLPQLEMHLAAMRKQAKEVAALAREPATPIALRRVADVAALQSIFGPDARITAVEDGFRILIPAAGYTSWWDQTEEALSRHALVLRTASLTRADGQKTGGSVVAVDMRLGIDARAPGPTAGPISTPAAQGR